MPGFQPGQMIGHYKVVNLLGKGGMATVYKGYQVEMDRFVAIKVLEHQFATDAEFIGRFRQEARLIARLEHPHILPVYDFGESDGLPYFAMRYLEAGTLSERLKAGPLTLQEVDRIFTQFADALAYAHEKGVIHRDVKPSNAMLDQKGNLFLTDFGIAKLVEGTTHLTAVGAITGTPAYMSPEQAMGEKVGIQADIFSLGVVLYEMLTGSTPFTAETPLAIMLKMVNEPLPAPRTINPLIHPALERVVLKSLSKDPADRYISMQEFLRAWRSGLREAAQNKPVQFVSGQKQIASISTGQKPSAIGKQAEKLPLKKQTRVWLIVFPILVIAGIALLYFSGILPGFPAQPVSLTNSAPPSKQETAAPPKSVFLNSLVLPRVAASEWAFWSDQNNVSSVNIFQNFLLATSPDGITIWDLSNREHINLNTQNGLPNGLVLTGMIDKDQNVLLGTTKGLLQIKDKNLTLINSDSGKPDIQISVMSQNGDLIFIGSKDCSSGGSGLWVYSGDSIKPVQDFPSSRNDDLGKVSCRVSTLFSDLDGSLWVGTNNGLAHLENQTWIVFSGLQGLPAGEISRITRDQSGKLLVVTPTGLFSLVDDAVSPMLGTNDLGLAEIKDFVQDKNGNYWFAGIGGLVKYNPGDRSIKHYTRESGQLATNLVTSATLDSNGMLYFGSDSGILVTKDGQSFESLVLTNTLVNPGFDRVLSAPDGSIWFGNRTSTLVDQYLPQNDAWSNFPANNACCLIPFGFYTDGTIFGGGDTGVWFIHQDTTIHLTTREGLISNNVNAIEFYGDRKVLIGTDKGMQNLNGDEIIGTLIPTKYGLPSDEVTSLYIAPDQSTWVGLRGGMLHVKPDNSIESFIAPDVFAIPPLAVTGFATDLGGNLWVTTIGNGIYKLDSDTWTQYSTSEIKVNNIYSVTVAPNGNLWFGTDGSGALKYDGQQWTTIDQTAGLMQSTIKMILAAADGSIWFAGPSGISRYKP